MKIRSSVPENGCLIFLADGKKQKINKKTEKTSVKLIRYRLMGGCVKKALVRRNLREALVTLLRC